MRFGRITILAAVLFIGALAAGSVLPAGEDGQTSVGRFADNASPLSPEVPHAAATSFHSLQAAMDTGLSLSTTLLDRSDGVMAAMKTEREKQAAGSGLVSQSLNRRNVERLWVKQFGVVADRPGQNGMPGYVYNSGGAAMGYDRVWGDFFGGVGVAVADGGFDARHANDDNRIASGNLGLYGGYRHRSGIFSKFLGGYGYGDNRMTEYVDGAGSWQKANFSSDTVMIGNVTGVEFQLEGLKIMPSFGLIRQRAYGRPHAATGAVRQGFTRLRADSLAVPLDLSLSYTAGLGNESSVTVGVKGGYRYELNDRPQSGIGPFDDDDTPLAARGLVSERDAMLLGGGLNYHYKRFDVGANYLYEEKNQSGSHFLGGSVGVSF